MPRPQRVLDAFVNSLLHGSAMDPLVALAALSGPKFKLNLPSN